jgi:hypothetical protein
MWAWGADNLAFSTQRSAVSSQRGNPLIFFCSSSGFLESLFFPLIYNFFKPLVVLLAGE